MAGLRQKIPAFVEHIKNNQQYFETNLILFDIYEGSLLKYVEQALVRQLSKESYDQIKHRLSPINVLIRIIDKLSKIYQQEPVREIVDGNASDTKLLRWYEQMFMSNQKWNVSNEFFNLFKNNLLQPFVHERKPRLRPIPSDRFIPWSDSLVDPTIPTVQLIRHSVMDIINPKTKKLEGTSDVWIAYDADESILFNMNEDLVRNPDAIDGSTIINPIGRIPFTYINRSHNLLVPKQDSDTIAMTLLIPVLLSDLNFISMFQAFSIIYGVNVTDKGITFAPNAFWSFEEHGDGEKKAQIGTIKPEADLDQLISAIQTQLAMWLQSRGIKPGAMGDMSVESLASGISKMIDEMDTTEARKKQVEFYQNAEADFWDMVMHDMHPYWMITDQIDSMPIFSQNAKVLVNYAEQMPATRRADTVVEMKSEVDAGFTTRRRAIARLNPKMTEEQVDKLIEEIDEERTIELPEDDDTSSGSTSETDGHAHDYTVDTDSNGQTAAANGHSHQIVGRVVQESEGHSHTLG